MSTQVNDIPAAWEGFVQGDWAESVNVRNFIQKNYTPYEGGDEFLAGATQATNTLWADVMEGIKEENRTHAPVDFDTDLPSTINSHDAGYIRKDLEIIVGLQTEKPLKRAIILTVVSAWSKLLVKFTARSLIRWSIKYSLNIARLTMLVFSTYTRPLSVRVVSLA